MTSTSLQGLPGSYKRKRIARLKEEIATGTPLSEFSQEERDLMHMETSEHNVLYWKHENEVAESDARCIHCQAIARSIIVALRALEAPIDDTRDSVLVGVLTEAAALPATH